MDNSPLYRICAAIDTMFCLISGWITFLITYLWFDYPTEDYINPTSQKIPRLLWNLKAWFYAHKSQPFIPILGQSNSVHSTITFSSNVPCTVILTYMSTKRWTHLDLRTKIPYKMLCSFMLQARGTNQIRFYYLRIQQNIFHFLDNMFKRSYFWPS